MFFLFRFTLQYIESEIADIDFVEFFRTYRPSPMLPIKKMFDTEFLARLSTRLINEVKGINRVVYDVTSKTPGTIDSALRLCKLVPTTKIKKENGKSIV